MRLLSRILLIALMLGLVSVYQFRAEEIVIAPSVRVIEEEAFSEDNSVKTLVLNENVEKIGRRAFADCGNLAEVYCFSNTVQIDITAFEDSRNPIVYCYQNSTMEQFAKAMGYEIRRPILFEVACDTRLNGAVGLPITWEAKWLAPLPEGELAYTWTLMRKGDQKPVTEVKSDEDRFVFTPKTADAYTVSLTINDISNSVTRSSEAVEVKQNVYFGIYEQDGKTSTADKLEWTVLDVKDGEALLITKKIIKNESFFNPEWIKYKYTYWAESCVGSASDINWWGVIAKDSMKITGITPDHVPLADHTFGKEADIFYVHSRYWLNEVFYESAFTEDEKSRIVTVYNVNEDNPQYGTESGPDSVDKVFFLSYSEMIQYMPTAASRKVTMTTMAMRESGDNIGKYWWLRTSGAHQWFAMHIQGSDGNISYYGSDVGHDNVGYRPCIRIRVGG